MTYLKYAALVMIVLLVVGCGTKDPISSTTPSTSYIMPLKVGNSWTYRVRLYGPTSPNPTDSLDWQIKIVAQQVSNDTTWYRALHIVSQAGFVDTTMELYYTNLADGLYLSGSPSSGYLKLLYPVTSGQSFTGNSEWYGSLSVNVISTNISVSATLGNYQCVYYKSTYSTYRIMHEYYKPNMGMAKMEWEYYSSTYGWYKDVEFDLIALTLN